MKSKWGIGTGAGWRTLLIAACAGIATLWTSAALRGAKKPLMEMRLYKYKNFAVCSFLMLMTGGILNAPSSPGSRPLDFGP